MAKEKILKKKNTIKNIDFYHPVPSKVSMSGYKGRVGIYESLMVSESIKALINKGATSQELGSRAEKEGMKSMIEDGFIKASQGVTSLEEVLRVIVE